MIRYGGAPQGAAVVIFSGGKGSQSPSAIPEKAPFTMKMGHFFIQYTRGFSGIMSVFIEIIYRDLTFLGLWPRIRKCFWKESSRMR